MGPKRDVVAELEKAIKKRDMKFVTTFHHATNWTAYSSHRERRIQSKLNSESGEAIYGTTAWIKYGEGPAHAPLPRGYWVGDYVEFQKTRKRVQLTAQDIRFTVKDNVIYAISLDWPSDEVTIRYLAGEDEYVGLHESEIKSVKMLGVDEELEWKMTEDGLTIKPPDKKPCEHAFTFRIERKL